METRISSRTKTVTISSLLPTVLIGERINPTGRKRLAAALKARDFGFVQREAVAQAEAGAAVIDVNVGAAGVNEVEVLPLAVRLIAEVVDVPLCLDSANPEALEAALRVYEGKALVNSVNAGKKSLSAVLPIVREYGAAVIGLTMDERGIPPTGGGRLELAKRILARAEGLGVPPEDVIIDCLAMTVGENARAGLATLEAIQLVADQLGVNQTLGASNISFGLPARKAINSAFLSMAILSGVTCPIVDVDEVSTVALATDLILGRDEYALRYIRHYRNTQGLLSKPSGIALNIESGGPGERGRA